MKERQLGLIVLIIILQFLGNPIEVIIKETIPEDHPYPIVTVYRFGFPFQFLEIRNIQGCTTTIHLETEGRGISFLVDFVFWVDVFLIIEWLKIKRHQNNLDPVGVD